MANTQRTLKDRLFCSLFGNSARKALALELYNALNGTQYTNPEDIQINTIGDVVYMGMRNDVSFLLANDLNMYEQQSTWNPNMPLRCFLYTAHAIERYLHDTGKDKKIYGANMVYIPTPKLVVLYNIDESKNSVPVQDQVLKFSDCFMSPKSGDVEVTVHAYNINPGNWLPSRCIPLNDYSSFVDSYRKFAKDANTDEERVRAANAAIDQLPYGRVREYISSQRSEVIDMLLTEYNEAEVMEAIKEEAREEGKAQGLAQGIEEGVATGRTQGETRLVALISAMTKGGDAAYVTQVSDPAFREEMYKKYNL